MKRLIVVVGTKRTLFASPRIAAATARQSSASMPLITPWLSASEKPATPVDTPQTSMPRALIASSVADPCPAHARAAIGADSQRERAGCLQSIHLLSPKIRRAALRAAGHCRDRNESQCQVCRVPLARRVVAICAAMLHLMKLCVGVRDPAELRAWQAERARRPPLRHLTRHMPRRAAEIVAPARSTG